MNLGRPQLRAWIAAAAALAAVLTLALAASGCSVVEQAEGGDVSARKVRVTATTNFIADTARNVGGDRVEVTGLMGPGVDPHLYRASAVDVRTLRDADVIFYGGLHLEGKMGELLERLAEHQPTVAVSRTMPERELLERAPGEHDPHVWFDVGLWKHAVDAIRDGLIARDPAHARTYRENAAAYQRRLDALDAYAREGIASIPRAKRLLVTSHDAFTYFGRRYGLEVAAIQGISTAAEATTHDIQRVARLLAERGVGTVFVESSVPKQTLEAVVAAARARGQEVRIGAELYADAAGDAGTEEGTYLGMVRANVDHIVEGLTR